MKLCWLIADDKGGGIVSVALSCARQASLAGHDATILLLTSSIGWLGREHLEGVHVHSLGCAPGAAEAPIRIVEWLAQSRHDFLFINGVGEFDQALGYVPEFTRAIYVVHDTARRYWQPAVDFEESLDAIVAVSDTVARQIRPNLRLPAKLHVLHNGSYFPPDPGDKPERKRQIMFCGGGSPGKGAGDLLRLWPKLMKEGYDGSLQWFGHLAPEFIHKIQSLPNSERIHLRGRCPRTELFAAAAESRVFLMLSRVEPFGMVTIEAMSMGCVPVAWDIETGTREIFSSGEHGYFAPLGNYRALAAQTLRAMESQPVLGRRCRDHARTKFSEAAMWERYDGLLVAIMRGRAVQRRNAGERPPQFLMPFRMVRWLPAGFHAIARHLISSNPRLGYLLRDWRGL